MTRKRAPSEAETTRERLSRLVMKVEVYLNYNLFRQAQVAVKELLELSPDHLRGHEFRLRIAEANGKQAEVLRELVKLAQLTVQTPETANAYLHRARQRYDDDEVRAAAEKIGLELDRMFRVPGSLVLEPPPEEWPFVPDHLCERSVILRRLENSAEPRIEEATPRGDESMKSLAVALLKVALSVPTGERRTVMFVDKTLSYVVFVSGQFAAVHEYTQSSLGRVAGRLHRLTFEENHP